MKKIFAVILPVVILFGALFGYITINNQGSLGYVSVDINPSVQFITNGNDEVIGVTASNDDGELILMGQVEALLGMSIEEATQKIVELAIEYGYLDPEALQTNPNAVSISTILENQNTRLQNRLRERVRANLENYFKNNGIYGVVLTDLNMQDVIVEAEELGISPGRLKLIRSVESAYEEYTTEELLDKPVKELIALLRNAKDINSNIENLQNKLASRQNELATIEASIDTITNTLNSTQTLLDELLLEDTSAYNSDALLAYQEQVAQYTQNISELQAQLTQLNLNLVEAQNMINAFENLLQNKQNKFNEIEQQLNTRRSEAQEKYNNWQENKQSRAQEVRNSWQNFKNNLSDETINNLVDYFQNAWGNR